MNQTCEVEFDLPLGQQVTTARGISVVHLAAAYGHLECLEHLLDIPETFSIDGAAEQDVSPLLCAVWYGQYHIVQYLLASGARTTTSLSGLSPLHVAALGGHVDTVSVLLSCGCDVEATDGHGLTALAYAMAAGHMAVVATM